ATTYRAIGAVDIALWDIAGKVAGQPIHRLLGSYRDTVPAYASSAVLASKEAYAEEATRFKAEGWTAYKIHPPTDPKVDIEVCEAVRRSVGDRFTVMLDSTWAYVYPDALRVGQAVERLGFHWYEDPLADDDIYNYVKLKQKLSIPILATEYAPGGFTAFAPWLTAQATDYLRGDVAVKGGITSLVKTAHLADAEALLAGELGGRATYGMTTAAFRFRHWRYEGGGDLGVLEPAGAGGFLHRCLAQRGPGIHHVTFPVPSLVDACDRARALGYAIVGYDDSDPEWKEAF